MNSFGRKLRMSIFGESHGAMLGVVVDGVPAGMALSVDEMLPDLDRRRSGKNVGTTTRRESDVPTIVSGIFNGYTTGAPVTVVFGNEDVRSADYAAFQAHPRPSHADFVARSKFNNCNDPRGGGHFSGRVTLGLVAAGIIAKKIIKNVEIKAEVNDIGGRGSDFDRVVEEAMSDGDSVGGIVECRAIGVPVGLGEPFFDSVESVLSHLLFAIPGIKGVEFGRGFQSANIRGSENNDPIVDRSGRTKSNNAGGIVGGVTNGNELVIRVAVKPTSSIGCGQMTYNLESEKVEELRIGGRHDACIALRIPVVVEAAVALVLADFILIG